MSWVCPNCDRELLKENQTHYCARVSVDSLFKGKSEELVLVFDKLLAEVTDWKDVIVSTTPHCIVFVHRKTFLVIRPMQKVLDIKFYSLTAQNSHPIINSTLYAGKYANNIRIKTTDELTPQVFKLIYQSYVLL
ncbi:DUF5655 domain-containing protein [Mucilaginibacter gotjawali]|uniref:Uncharacterized protein n=2 Tax=Mucilaginibacter gotjawali TaxID=1550579 RepID=A0A839SK00_9SPHI|nr:DUF5655 domain-containing protein [Mucilaginibacter gotjawali]MBB3058615.1 hypothetical protein [Mucilaginibacter gotjawali]BAU52418.1 hypothetical protein MgSA37_00579 [Mucilaginibacter gotjawali]